MSVYLPPGCPTGIRRVEVTLTCANGHTYDVPGTVDEMVGWTEYDENAPCPRCEEQGGEDVTHD